MAGLLDNLMWNALDAALLAVAVAAVARLAKLRAPARHVLWLLVLLKLLVPPVAIHSFGLSGICASTVEQVRGYAVQWPQPVQVARPDRLIAPDSFDEPTRVARNQSQDIREETPADGWPEDADSLAVEPPIVSLTESLAETPATVWASAADLPAAGSSDAAPASSTATGGASFWNRLTAVGLARGLIWFWAAGSLGLFAIRIKQCAVVLRLVRQAQAAPPSVVAACREVARRFDLSRVPQVRIVARALSPTVCVLGRTTILLPADLVNRCGTRVVRSVLAHELAHLKRHDHWLCWIELIGSCLYWWHLVFWWARHELRRAADESADAWAVSVLGCRQQYAESLLQTVELLVADRAVAAAWCPALGQRDTIARRLTMIMKEPLSRRLSWPAWLAVAVVGLLVLPAAPLRSSAQDPPKPPPGVPSDDEIAAAVEAFDAATPQRPREPGAEQPSERVREPGEHHGPQRPREPGAEQPPSRDRRPDGPRPPDAGPRDGQRQPPQPPGGRVDGPRDPERRLQELEAKLDRIMQMLESRPGQPGVAATPGIPPGAQPPGSPGGFPPFAGMRGMGGGGLFGPGRGGFGGGFGLRTGRGPDAVDEMLRGIELAPEQRERIEHAMRDVDAELQKVEAEQARVMQEFQRHRMELERRRAEIIHDVLSPEQRERLQQRGRGGERSRDRGEVRPEGRGGPERPRDATEPRRDGGPERSPEGARDRGGPGPDRPREATEPRRPDREQPRDGELPRRRPEREQPANEAS